MHDGMRDLERELHQHAAALRGLARDLVGAGDADDVLQETALQALRSPPRAPGPLAGWLFGIVRHVALRHRRTRGRQLRREQAAARDETLPPDASVDASDSLRALTDAVLALPQPYRATVFARYLRDQSPAVIAAELGEPVGTVKTRLKRGLAMLRERLDDDAGRRGGDWRAGLVGAFGLERITVGTSAAAGGGLLMTTTTKWMFAGAATVLLGAGYLLLAPSRSATTASPPSAGAPVVAAPPPAGIALPLGQGSLTLPTIPAAPREPAASTASAAAECVVRGRCVDEAGRPLAAMTVELDGWVANDQRLAAWCKQHDEPAGIDERVITGSDGVFAFRFWPPPPFRFGLRLQGSAVATRNCDWDELRPGTTQDLGDLAFAPGTLLRGRVVDADGAPVAKVWVRVNAADAERLPRGYENWTDALTNADGTFTARWALHAGDYSLGIDDQRLETSTVQLRGEPVKHLELRLQRVDGDRSLSGVVVDDEGSPVRGVVVSPHMSGQGRVISTDAEGRFRVLRRDDSPARIGLSLLAEGYEAPPLDETFAFGRHDLRFVVKKGQQLEVHVVHAGDGTPVEDFRLRVVPNGGAGWSSEDFRVRGGTRHAGGRASVDGLKSGPNHVVVEPRDEGLAIGVVPIQITGARLPPVVVKLAATSERRVRVQRADGTPVVDATVQLVDPLGAKWADTMPALPLEQWGTTSAAKALVLATATTAAGGEATLRVPDDRALGLFLPGPAHVPLRIPHVVFPADGAFVVTIAVGARVQGRLGPEAAFAEVKRLAGIRDGEARPFWPMFELWRDGPNGRVRFPELQRRPQVAADGSFELNGIPQGRWRLVFLCMQRDPGGRGGSFGEEDGGFVELVDGETATVAVDLSSLLPGELEAVVLRNGVPLANTTVQLQAPLTDHPDGHPYFTRAATTDADGRLRATVRKGLYSLTWNASRSIEPWSPVRAVEQASVEVGATTRVTFSLATGVLDVRLVDAAGHAVEGVGIELRDATGVARVTMPPGDKDGRTTLDIEAATFTASVLPKRLLAEPARTEFAMAHRGEADPFASVRVSLGTVVVRAAQTNTVELRLPATWDR